MVHHEQQYLFGVYIKYCIISDFDRNTFKCFSPENALLISRKKGGEKENHPLSYLSKIIWLTFKVFSFQCFSLHIFYRNMIISYPGL
jgi:hypothetical protein